MKEKMEKRKYPKISIITPTLNQSRYINQTIESVLNQAYPNLEYIIIDGGSTDGTQEILKKYKKKITYISEKDTGQSEAINKGLRMASGAIFGYLNSDDLLAPGALSTVADYFNSHKHCTWLTGYCAIIDGNGKPIRSIISSYKNFWLQVYHSFSALLVLNFISQPATFFNTKALQSVGFFNEKLHYSMDYDFWLRLSDRFPLHVVHKKLALFRVHQSAKGVRQLDKQLQEGREIAQKYTPSRFIIFLHSIHDFMIKTVYNILILL